MLQKMTLIIHITENFYTKQTRQGLSLLRIIAPYHNIIIHWDMTSRPLNRTADRSNDFTLALVFSSSFFFPLSLIETVYSLWEGYDWLGGGINRRIKAQWNWEATLSLQRLPSWFHPDSTPTLDQRWASVHRKIGPTLAGQCWASRMFCPVGQYWDNFG